MNSQSQPPTDIHPTGQKLGTSSAGVIEPCYGMTSVSTLTWLVVHWYVWHYRKLGTSFARVMPPGQLWSKRYWVVTKVTYKLQFLKMSSDTNCPNVNKNLEFWHQLKVLLRPGATFIVNTVCWVHNFTLYTLHECKHFQLCTSSLILTITDYNINVCICVLSFQANYVLLKPRTTKCGFAGKMWKGSGDGGCWTMYNTMLCT